MPIVLNGSGPITGVTSLNTTVSDTEIGYLDGVTSALQTQINTKPTGGTGAWTAYTPTWTATPSNPVLGNGTLTGRYVQIGKTVHFRIYVSIGSTTTLTNTGNWTFTVPVAMENAFSGNGFSGRIDDVGAASYIASSYHSTTTSFLMATPASITTLVGVTTPMNWVAGDQLWISGTYEAA